MAQNPFLESPLETATDRIQQERFELPPLPQEEAAAPAQQPAAAPSQPKAKKSGDDNYAPPPDLRPLFESAARKYNVPVNVLMALGHQESRFNPSASAIGVPTQWGRAKGMMQYLDDTASRLGINPFEPTEAVSAAARQIRERLDKGYSMEDAVKAHFAGDNRKLWKDKTAAYGREVLAKAARIGETLYPFDQSPEEVARRDRQRTEIQAQEAERTRMQQPASAGLPQQAPRERTWGEVASDTGVQLAEGANNIIGAVPNLVSPQGEVAAFFNRNAQYWSGQQSEPLKQKIDAANAKISEAGKDGILSQMTEAASTYFSDPGLAARFITTNLPSMIPGIAAAKVAQAAAVARGATAAKAAAAATTAAGGANAVLNAGGARGEAFNDIKQTLMQQGMAEDKAIEQALKDSRIVAAVGAATGYLSGKTGLESALVGKQGASGAVRAGIGATAAELAGEQAEEVLPKLTTNYQAGQYDKRSLGKDVGRTIVETAIGSGPGAMVSGGAAALNARGQQAAAQPAPSQAPQFDMPPDGSAFADPSAQSNPVQQRAPTVEGDWIPAGDYLPTWVAEESNPAGPMTAALENAASQQQAAASPQGATPPAGPLTSALAKAAEQASPQPAAQQSALPDALPAPQPAQAAQSYADRYQSRIEAIKQANTQDEVKAILGEEYGDDERHMDGTGLVEREARKRTREFEQAAAEQAKQDALKRGEWVSARDGSMARSKAESEAAKLNQQGDGFEYAAQPDNYDGYAVMKRKSSQLAAKPASIEDASEQDLRARLRYLAGQAKSTGGWNKMLMDERRKIERQIEKMSEASQPQAKQDADAEKPAAPTAQPAPAEQGKDEYAGKWFGSAEKAQGFIDKKKAGATHEAVQTGKVRWEIKPKQADAKPELKDGAKVGVMFTSPDRVEPATVIGQPYNDQSRGEAVQVALEGGGSVIVSANRITRVPNKQTAAKPAQLDDINAADTATVKESLTAEPAKEVPNLAPAADIVEVKDNFGRTHRVRNEDLKGQESRIPTVRNNGDVVSGEEIPRSIIKTAEPAASPQAEAKPITAKKGAGVTTIIIDPSAGQKPAKQQDAPGTRVNGDAERAAADRLEKLYDQMSAITNRNSLEGNAKAVIRSMIEELRRPKTVTNVVGVLEKSSSDLMRRKYGAFAQVVQEVADSLNGKQPAANPKPSDSQAVNDFIEGRRDTPPTVEEVKAEAKEGAAPVAKFIHDGFGFLTKAEAEKLHEEYLESARQSRQMGKDASTDFLKKQAKSAEMSAISNAKNIRKSIAYNSEAHSEYTAQAATAAEGVKAEAAPKAPQRFEYPESVKGDPEWLAPSQNAVVDFMNGEISKPALLQRFADLGLTEGQVRSVTNRIDLSYGEIESVAKLREAGKEVAKPTEPTPPTGGKKDQFSANKIFTADKVEAARARLKSKLGQLNSGIDPELLVDGMTIAGAYIEAGVRNFRDYAKAMTDDFGDSIKPYLLSFYEAARNYPGLGTEGMTPVGAAKVMHIELMKDADTSQVKEAIGETVEKPAKRTRKTGAKSDMTLTQDWGVDHIDGWEELKGGANEPTDYGLRGGVKDAFLKEARAYLNTVAGILTEQGYAPHTDSKGRPEKPVSVNESGVATSGDVILTLVNPETGSGIYVHIGDTSLRGVVPTTQSGIAIMFRAASADNKFGTGMGSVNRWAPVDLSAADFSMLLDKEAKSRAAKPSIAPTQAAAKITEEVKQNDTQGNQAGADDRAQEPSAGAVRATESQQPAGRGAEPDRGQSRAVDSGSAPAGNRGGNDAGQAGVRARPAAENADAEQPVQGRGERSPAAGRRGADEPASSVANYRIQPGELKREGSWRATAERNIGIVELVKKITAEGRQATPEERAQLAKFTGWGASEIANGVFPDKYGRYKDETWRKLGERLQAALTPEEYAQARRTTQYAHYTSESVIRSIYDGLQRLGVAGGTLLEPGMGIGHFNGLMPDGMAANTRYTGIEYDTITGNIAKLLYPASNVIVGDYTRTNLPKDFFDAAIGNPPFSSTQVLTDPEYKSRRPMLHDYFFMKTIDRVKPGGVLVFVTSKGTMDKASDKSRKYLAERANLLGAVRLPQTAFKDNAGTEVVTDVIFLQKRGPGIADNGMQWLGTKEVETPQGPTAINEYFADHPDMVLGKHALTGSMYRKDEYTVLPPDGDIEQLFAKALQALPENVSRPVPGSLAERALVQDRDFNPKHKKEGGLYLSDDGKLMQVDNGSGVEVAFRSNAEGKQIALTPKQKKWLRDYVGLRDALKQAQYDQLNDGNWEKSLKALNKAYDVFVKEHGHILEYTTIERTAADGTVTETKRYKNEPLLRIDAEGALAYALENVKEDGTIIKGAVLNSRVLETPREPEIKTTQDALFVSLNRNGALVLDDVATLAGTDKETVIRDLGTAIYDAPGEGWKLADDYLSGNVVRKLKEARAAAEVDPRYKRNVEALLAAQPRPLGPTDITVRLGANWVPASDIEKFGKEVLGEDMDITYNPLLNKWDVEQKTRSLTEWGFDKMTAGQIIDAVLNNRQLKVTYRDQDNKTHVDLEATEKANDISRKMRERFSTWLWTDAKRAERLVAYYNENFNNIAPRQFDGSHLTLPGVSARFKLYPHQKRAVWRVIQQGDTYLAHAVGAGKAQPLDAKILTPNGWVLMGDIAVGDMVIAADGTPTMVEAVFPQGSKDIYRVVFSDGSSTECCAEHLWLTQTYKERSAARAAAKAGKDWPSAKPRVRELSEIMETLVSSHLGAKNHSIPMVAPVQFAEREIPLDPYTLGALLGDGSMSNGVVTFSKPDSEIVYQFALPENVMLNKIEHDGKCDAWRFVMKKRDGFGADAIQNPMVAILSGLGLMNTCSHQRFIPDVYKFNTVDVRLAVLRGLMDTDGYVDRRGHSTYLTTTSLQLADDVQFIVQSLGGVVSKSNKRPFFTHNGERKEGRLAYVLTISLPAGINPFMLERKASAVVPKTKYAPTRYITAVELVGSKPAQCIRVAHPEHLYVTDDFIVTHNTMEMIAAGMEERRLGLVNKPMYVVPNHMLAQFSREFLELYPAANIMVADEHNFHTHNRKRFVAQAALNNPDAIVITHSAFGRIGMSDEYYTDFIQRQIDDWKEALEETDDRITVKQIERRIEQLEQRMEGRQNRDKKDQVLSFEELGVDKLYVDEFHEFRKLDFATNQGNVKGIDPNGSQRALDLFMKVEYLRSKKPGRSLVAASGTPVTNTMGELFTSQRFFQPEQMKEDGLESFDAWSSQYGDIVTGFEQNAAGGYEMVARFAKFQNVPELMRRVRSFMDILTSSNLGELVKRPDVENGSRQVEVTPSPEGYKEFQQQLQTRIQAIRNRKGPPKKGEDIILNVIGDGRFSAIDMRFVDPTLPSDPNSKLNVAIDQIISAYKQTASWEYSGKDGSKDPLTGSTIILFTDIGLGEQSAASRGFDMRGWIEQRLTEAGIPREHIAFMRDFKQHAKKERMFSDMREGKKRILIGGKEMETGTNVQKRLSHLFHLDAPWFPASVEQREGRAVRQGNQNKQVVLKAFATKGSYDSTMWGMNARKARFIEQAMNGDDSVRSMDDVSEASAFEMAAALASGDERYMKLAGLKADVDRLDRLRHAHYEDQNRLMREKHWADEQIKRNTARAKDLAAAIAKRKPIRAGEFEAKVGKATYDNREEFSQAVFKEFQRLAADNTMDEVAIGEIGGFPIRFYGTELKGGNYGASLHVELPGDPSPLLVFPLDPEMAVSGIATRAANQVNGLDKELAEAQRYIDTGKAKVEQADKRLGAPFPEEALLLDKVAELNNLETELAAESKQAAAEAAAATAEVDGTTEQQEAAEDGEPRYSVNADGQAEGEFGPVTEEYRNDPAGAVKWLQENQTGEAIIDHPTLGEISLIWGDGTMGLSHIAARRGEDFLSRIPAILESTTVYEKANQKGRVFLGNEADEATIRLDWNGQAKAWLVSAYEKYGDAKQSTQPQKANRSAVVRKRSGKLSIDSLRKEITSGAIGQVIARLIDNGQIVLHANAETLPKAARGKAGVQAVTLANGQIHLVANRLSPNNARSVLLHEMFHMGGEALVGSKEWGNLMGRLGSLKRQASSGTGKMNEFFQRANERVEYARAQGAVSTGMTVEEFGAYAIEEYEQKRDSLPAVIRKWVEDLIGTIKAYVLQRYGKQLGAVTPAQLAAMAKLVIMNAAAMAERGQPSNATGKFSVAPEQPNSARAKRNREAVDKNQDAYADAKAAQGAEFSRFAGVVDQAGRNVVKGINAIRTTWGLVSDNQKAIPSIRDAYDLEGKMDGRRIGIATEASKAFGRDFSEMAIKDPAAADKLADLMTQATLWQIKPDKPKNDRWRAEWKAKYDELRAMWDALPQEAKDLYDATQKFYEARSKDIHNALKERIMALEIGEKQKRDMLAELQERFDRELGTGPYFPLARFGSYLVIGVKGEGDNAQRVVMNAEYAPEAKAMAAELRNRGYEVTTKMAKEQAQEQDMRQSSELVRKIAEMIEMQVPDFVAGPMLDELNQIFLDALPLASARKSFIHRKNVAGFSRDMARALNQSAVKLAGQVAKLEYAQKIEEAFVKAEKQAEASPDNFDLQPVVAEMRRRFESTMRFKTNPVAAALQQAGFAFTLGYNLSSAAVNLLQMAIAGGHMGARHGAMKANAQIAKALGEISSMVKHREKHAHWFDLRKTGSQLSAGEKKMLEALEQSGKIDVTAAMDAYRAAHEDTKRIAESKVGRVMQKVMDGMGVFMQAAEVVNRQAVALAAYRMELQKTDGDVDAAIKYAAEVLDDTQFNMNISNQPRFMHNNAVRVVMQYKGFAINMMDYLGRTMRTAMDGMDKGDRRQATKALGLIFGMQVALAGIGSLPLYMGAAAAGAKAGKMAATAAGGGAGAKRLASVLGGGVGALALAAFLNGAFGDDDEPWDWKADMRRWLAENTNATLAQLLDRGLFSIAGVDIADRISMNGMMMRDLQEQHGKKAWQNMAEEAALGMGGVALSKFYLGGARALDALEQGNVKDAIIAMLPLSPANAVKGVDMAANGVTDKRTGAKLMDVNAIEAMAQAFGFQPSSVRERRWADNVAYNADKQMQDRKSRLLDGIAKAVLSDDSKAEDAAWEAAERWNDKNADLYNPITMRDVNNRVRQLEDQRSMMEGEARTKGQRQQLERQEVFKRGLGGQ